MERSLLQQIVTAIDASYLQALRDENTHRLEKIIPEVFEYLFDTYVDVTIKELTIL